MSSEFPVVAGTQNNIPNNNIAFQTALQRAKEVAAKISIQSVGSTSESQKRPLDDPGLGEPEVKKQAILPSYGLTSPNSSLQQAIAVAASISAKVASPANNGQGVGIPGLHLTGSQTKDIKVPDKMVGLIIGRGGEQITRLQAESGCKIQMASESNGMSDRLCTLTGSAQCMAKAEELIQQIVNSRSREIPGNMSNGSVSPMQNSRLSDPLSSSSMTPSIPTVAAGGLHTQVEIMVPGSKVGLIIGKGGETIKQLQEKSGAKMIVIQDGPSQEHEKPLRISGEHSKVEAAKALVYEFMAEKEQQLQNRSGGRPSGGFNQNPRSWDMDASEDTITVPSSKCGVIIGKGGETIKQINQQSGAHCEIDRKQPPNVPEKIFIIRGNPEQIEHAKRLFNEKLNMDMRNSSNGHNGNYAMMGGHGMGMGGYNGGSGWPVPTSQSYQQQSWPNSQSQNQTPQVQQPAGGANVNPATGQADYSAQWVEYYKSMGMLKEAAMIEEQAKINKQMTGQQGMHSQGITPQGQVQMPDMSGMNQGQIPMAGQQNASQMSGDQAGKPDYSAQWAQYYRSLGQHKEAEAIEAQMKNKIPSQSGQPATTGGMVPSQPNSVPGMYNQPAMAAAQYGMGGFPGSGANQNYYGAPQPQGTSAAPYAYPNYGAYQQQPASNDSHQQQQQPQ